MTVNYVQQVETWYYVCLYKTSLMCVSLSCVLKLAPYHTQKALFIHLSGCTDAPGKMVIVLFMVGCCASFSGFFPLQCSLNIFVYEFYMMDLSIAHNLLIWCDNSIVFIILQASNYILMSEHFYLLREIALSLSRVTSCCGIFVYTVWRCVTVIGLIKSWMAIS